MRIFIKKKKKNEKNVLLKTKMSWRDPILFFSSKSIKKIVKKPKIKMRKMFYSRERSSGVIQDKQGAEKLLFLL